VSMPARGAMNLAQWVSNNARRFATHPAVIQGDTCWTWFDFEQRINQLAHTLLAHGVQPGQAVLVHSSNSPAMFASMFAAFRIGAIWAPANFRLLPQDVVGLAQLTQAPVFLCQNQFADHAAAVRAACPEIHVLPLEASLFSAAPTAPVAHALVAHDSPCWLFFTSGTTGKPKAAILTHGQMACVVTNHLCDLMPGTTENDGALVVAPLSHGAGIHQLCAVARGAPSVLLPTAHFDAAQAFALIERYRLTNLFTVPTLLNMLAQHPAADSHDHSSLRYVIYAGAPMYRADQQRALEKLGPVLVQYYGLGEVTGCITVLPPHEHRHLEQRPGTCGFARTGMHISIQDDNGHEVPQGATGEVCVIGPAVCAGYWNNPEANAQAFRNGWFRTGDFGTLDSSGYLYLNGRASDMYISGGSNIYPREIEEQLLLHPAIREAAVVGIPDNTWGEIGIALCALHEDAALEEAPLLDWLGTHLARYKLPKRIFFWQTLPQSGYGKVTKRLLREELQRRGVVDEAGMLITITPALNPQHHGEGG